MTTRSGKRFRFDPSDGPLRRKLPPRIPQDAHEILPMDPNQPTIPFSFSADNRLAELIFSRIWSVVDRCQIALVCREFNRQLRTPESWSHIKQLSFTSRDWGHPDELKFKDRTVECPTDVSQEQMCSVFLPTMALFAEVHTLEFRCWWKRETIWSIVDWVEFGKLKFLHVRCVNICPKNYYTYNPLFGSLHRLLLFLNRSLCQISVSSHNYMRLFKIVKPYEHKLNALVGVKMNTLLDLKFEPRFLTVLEEGGEYWRYNYPVKQEFTIEVLRLLALQSHSTLTSVTITQRLDVHAIFNQLDASVFSNLRALDIRPIVVPEPTWVFSNPDTAWSRLITLIAAKCPQANSIKIRDTICPMPLSDFGRVLGVIHESKHRGDHFSLQIYGKLKLPTESTLEEPIEYRSIPTDQFLAELDAQFGNNIFDVQIETKIEYYTSKKIKFHLAKRLYEIGLFY